MNIIYKLHIAIMELFYQQVLIAGGVFQRHRMLTTKFVRILGFLKINPV